MGGRPLLFNHYWSGELEARMLYLCPQTSDMRGFPSFFGVMTRPSDNCVPNGIKQGRFWAMDNEAFTRPSFDFERWKAHFDKVAPYLATCAFLTVPDAVGDAQASLDLWDEWNGRFRECLRPFDRLYWRRKPYKALAFVAQDGQESLPFPSEAEYIFIGGSTEWKMSDAADFVISRAWDERRFVHVGRVNSMKRVRHFQLLDDYVVSVDGTAGCFEPDTAKRRLTRQLGQVPLLSVV